MDETQLNILVGRRIKALRKVKKLSQEDLADIVEKSVDSISNIERGIFAPRLDTAFKIARALEVDLHELFQIQPMPVKDKTKAKILDDIVTLLKDQPMAILDYILTQSQNTIALKNRLMK